MIRALFRRSSKDLAIIAEAAEHQGRRYPGRNPGLYRAVPVPEIPGKGRCLALLGVALSQDGPRFRGGRGPALSRAQVDLAPDFAFARNNLGSLLTRKDARDGWAAETRDASFLSGTRSGHWPSHWTRRTAGADVQRLGQRHSQPPATKTEAAALTGRWLCCRLCSTHIRARDFGTRRCYLKTIGRQDEAHYGPIATVLRHNPAYGRSVEPDCPI